jgi:acyl carrier protein
MGSLAGTLTAEPETSSEAVLAEMLAGVMKIEQVAHNSHFFDDLGADSLVMAKFCARVRKAEGLPVMSMQDVFAKPTLRSLAEAVGIAEAEAKVKLDAIATLIQPRDPILARSAAPAPTSTRQYLACGALQLVCFFI